MESKSKTLMLMVVVFFVALMVVVIPLPYWGEFLRPHLALLVLIYWQLAYPERINFFAILFLGLLLDLLHNVFLGEHALALFIVSYFLLKFHRRILMFSLGRQMLTIFGLLLGYEGTLLVFTRWLEATNFKEQYYWLIFSNVVISVLIWPCLAATLHKLQRYFKVS